MSDNRGKHVNGPRIMSLKAELMNRHAPDSWARVVQHSLDQRRDDIDGQWANLTPLASDGMDGVSADQWRSIAEGSLKRFTASLVSQVIHQRDARCPDARTMVCCSSDERCDRALTLIEKRSECLLPDAPGVGIQRPEGSRVIRVPHTALLPER